MTSLMRPLLCGGHLMRRPPLPLEEQHALSSTEVVTASRDHHFLYCPKRTNMSPLLLRSTAQENLHVLSSAEDTTVPRRLTSCRF